MPCSPGPLLELNSQLLGTVMIYNHNYDEVLNKNRWLRRYNDFTCAESVSCEKLIGRRGSNGFCIDHTTAARCLE